MNQPLITNNQLPITPSQPPSMSDTIVKGILSNLSQNFKVGDNMLLQLIMNDMGKFSVTLSDPKTNNPSISPSLSREGRGGSEPEIRLDRTLNLPPNKEIPINIRITGTTSNNIQFRLVSIDNQPVEKFIPTPQTVIASAACSLSRAQPREQSNQAINPNAVKTIELQQQPLKVAPELISKLETLNFPKEVITNIKNLAVNLGMLTDPKVKIPALTEQNLTEIIKTATPEKIIESLKGQIIKGEVISTPDKPLTIKTMLGEFIIDKDLKLPPKTEVLLSLKDISPRSPDTKTDTILDIIKPLLSKNTSATDHEHGSRTRIYRQIISKLPAADNKMIGNMINFIKSAQNKDLNIWLGKEVVQSLSSRGVEGQEVIAKLTNFLNNSVREPNVAWRTIEVPFLSGEIFGSIRVSIKENFDDQVYSGKKRKNGTRFLVDTNFSQLGEFQFDGFAVANDRRFDLVIRTSQQVDDDLFSHIFRIFKTTLHDLEYFGNLNVNVKENFIKICEDNHKTASNKGIYI